MEFASLLTNLHLQRNRYKESNVVILYRSNVIFTNFPQKTFRKNIFEKLCRQNGGCAFPWCFSSCANRYARKGRETYEERVILVRISNYISSITCSSLRARAMYSSGQHPRSSQTTVCVNWLHPATQSANVCCTAELCLHWGRQCGTVCQQHCQTVKR